MLSTALSQIGPGGVLGLVVAVAAGGWLVLKISRVVLKAYYFAFFSLIGAVLVLIASVLHGGNAPNPTAWIGGALAFGTAASVVRKKVARAITLAAVLGASYLFLGRPGLPSSDSPSSAQNGVHQAHK